IEGRLAQATAYDPTPPYKILAEFAIDEYLFALRQMESRPENMAACQALRKLLGHWSPPRLADLWPLDGEGATDSDKDSWFKLPWQKQHWEWKDFERPNSSAPQHLVALAGPLIRNLLLPRDGWYWPVARDEMLWFASKA